MVDEYQDTNTIQELILHLLAGDDPNLCVVGDDDQGLYRFRGATIRNILQFTDNFPPGDCDPGRARPSTTAPIPTSSTSTTAGSTTRTAWTVDGQTFRYDKDDRPARRCTSFPDVPDRRSRSPLRPGRLAPRESSTSSTPCATAASSPTGTRSPSSSTPSRTGAPSAWPTSWRRTASPSTRRAPTSSSTAKRSA